MKQNVSSEDIKKPLLCAFLPIAHKTKHGMILQYDLILRKSIPRSSLDNLAILQLAWYTLKTH